MTGTVVALAPRRPRVPPELQAVLDLLRTIADPALRRYCLEQIGAAEDPREVSDALALAAALGCDAGHARRAAAAGGGAAVAVVGLAPPAGAAIGQGPGAAGRASLRAARKRKVRCIATSSSP